jgi:hypothetical protein
MEFALIWYMVPPAVPYTHPSTDNLIAWFSMALYEGCFSTPSFPFFATLYVDLFILQHSRCDEYITSPKAAAP